MVQTDSDNFPRKFPIIPQFPSTKGISANGTFIQLGLKKLLVSPQWVTLVSQTLNCFHVMMPA